MGLLFVPIGLSARHDIREEPGADLLFIAGLVVLGALAAAIARAARRRSPWLLPLSLFAATLLPICWVRILAGALVAERFLFVPGGALALGVALLPGVTRDSTLALLRKWGLKVSERQVSIDEVVEAHGRGTLEEVWGTGTAAVISPVGELAYKGKKMVINGGRIGPLTQRLYDSIVAIQYGQAPDPDGWTLTI